MASVEISQYAKRVLSEALALSQSDRAGLIDELYLSLPLEPAIERRRAEEAESRVAAIDADEMDLIPAEDVFEELRREFGRS